MTVFCYMHIANEPLFSYFISNIIFAILFIYSDKLNENFPKKLYFIRSFITR
jgi:hypothetical protein